MSFICEKENEDVLRLLASNRKIMELILELGVVVNKSSLVELMNQGFQMNDLQHALEINLLNIENDFWLKNCVWKGDCAFLYLTAPVKLSERGIGTFNRLCHECYCIVNYANANLKEVYANLMLI